MTKSDNTENWPELAIALYDKLTGRGAEITYEFDRMTVSVPSAATEDAAHARWQLDGVVKIRARDNASGSPA